MAPSIRAGVLRTSFCLLCASHHILRAELKFRQLWVESWTTKHQTRTGNVYDEGLHDFLIDLLIFDQFNNFSKSVDVVNKQIIKNHPPFWRFLFWRFFSSNWSTLKIFGFLLGHQLSYFESWLVGSKDHTITTQTFTSIASEIYTFKNDGETRTWRNFEAGIWR